MCGSSLAQILGHSPRTEKEACDHVIQKPQKPLPDFSESGL